MITAWGDDGEECLFSFLLPLLVAGMEYAEGNGKWEEKWIALTGEPRGLLDIRREVGSSEIASNIKRVLFSPAGKAGGVDVERWVATLRKMEGTPLPPDLQFVKRCVETCIRRIEGRATAADLLGLASLYADLWLRERKVEGLERVYARFWAAASMIELERKFGGGA